MALGLTAALFFIDSKIKNSIFGVALPKILLDTLLFDRAFYRAIIDKNVKLCVAKNLFFVDLLLRTYEHFFVKN